MYVAVGGSGCIISQHRCTALQMGELFVQERTCLVRHTGVLGCQAGFELKNLLTQPLPGIAAQNSKAQILGLANAGGDTINSIKAAREFCVTKDMKLAGLLVFFTDVHSLGLKNTQGMQFTTSWYWDMNDASRKFADAFMAKTQRRPSGIQAADYSATMNWLKAVEKARSEEHTSELQSPCNL